MIIFNRDQYEITVTYSSIDNILVIEVIDPLGERFGIDEARSVDELNDALTDMIEGMESAREDQSSPLPDHEDIILDHMEELTPDDIDLLRDLARDYAQNNHPYMSYLGYKANVNYLPDQGMIEARSENFSPLYARSLKRLRRLFILQVREHLSQEAAGLIEP